MDDLEWVQVAQRELVNCLPGEEIFSNISRNLKIFVKKSISSQHSLGSTQSLNLEKLYQSLQQDLNEDSSKSLTILACAVLSSFIDLHVLNCNDDHLENPLRIKDKISKLNDVSPKLPIESLIRCQTLSSRKSKSGVFVSILRFVLKGARPLLNKPRFFLKACLLVKIVLSISKRDSRILYMAHKIEFLSILQSLPPKFRGWTSKVGFNFNFDDKTDLKEFVGRLDVAPTFAFLYSEEDQSARTQNLSKEAALSQNKFNKQKSFGEKMGHATKEIKDATKNADHGREKSNKKIINKDLKQEKAAAAISHCDIKGLGHKLVGIKELKDATADNMSKMKLKLAQNVHQSTSKEKGNLSGEKDEQKSLDFPEKENITKKMQVDTKIMKENGKPTVIKDKLAKTDHIEARSEGGTVEERENTFGIKGINNTCQSSLVKKMTNNVLDHNHNDLSGVRKKSGKQRMEQQIPKAIPLAISKSNNVDIENIVVHALTKSNKKEINKVPAITGSERSIKSNVEARPNLSTYNASLKTNDKVSSLSEGKILNVFDNPSNIFAVQQPFTEEIGKDNGWETICISENPEEWSFSSSCTPKGNADLECKQGIFKFGGTSSTRPNEPPLDDGTVQLPFTGENLKERNWETICISENPEEWSFSSRCTPQGNADLECKQGIFKFSGTSSTSPNEPPLDDGTVQLPLTGENHKERNWKTICISENPKDWSFSSTRKSAKHMMEQQICKAKPLATSKSKHLNVESAVEHALTKSNKRVNNKVVPAITGSEPSIKSKVEALPNSSTYSASLKPNDVVPTLSESKMFNVLKNSPSNSCAVQRPFTDENLIERGWKTICISENPEEWSFSSSCTHKGNVDLECKQGIFKFGGTSSTRPNEPPLDDGTVQLPFTGENLKERNWEITCMSENPENWSFFSSCAPQENAEVGSKQSIIKFGGTSRLRTEKSQLENECAKKRKFGKVLTEDKSSQTKSFHLLEKEFLQAQFADNERCVGKNFANNSSINVDRETEPPKKRYKSVKALLVSPDNVYNASKRKKDARLVEKVITKTSRSKGERKMEVIPTEKSPMSSLCVKEFEPSTNSIEDAANSTKCEHCKCIIPSSSSRSSPSEEKCTSKKRKRNKKKKSNLKILEDVVGQPIPKEKLVIKGGKLHDSSSSSRNSASPSQEKHKKIKLNKNMKGNLNLLEGVHVEPNSKELESEELKQNPSSNRDDSASQSKKRRRKMRIKKAKANLEVLDQNSSKEDTTKQHSLFTRAQELVTKSISKASTKKIHSTIGDEPVHKKAKLNSEVAQDQGEDTVSQSEGIRRKKRRTKNKAKLDVLSQTSSKEDAVKRYSPSTKTNSIANASTKNTDSSIGDTHVHKKANLNSEVTTDQVENTASQPEGIHRKKRRTKNKAKLDVLSRTSSKEDAVKQYSHSTKTKGHETDSTSNASIKKILSIGDEPVHKKTKFNSEVAGDLAEDKIKNRTSCISTSKDANDEDDLIIIEEYIDTSLEPEPENNLKAFAEDTVEANGTESHDENLDQADEEDITILLETIRNDAKNKDALKGIDAWLGNKEQENIIEKKIKVESSKSFEKNIVHKGETNYSSNSMMTSLYAKKDVGTTVCSNSIEENDNKLNGGAIPKPRISRRNMRRNMTNLRNQQSVPIMHEESIAHRELGLDNSNIDSAKSFKDTSLVGNEDSHHELPSQTDQTATDCMPSIREFELNEFVSEDLVSSEPKCITNMDEIQIIANDGDSKDSLMKFSNSNEGLCQEADLQGRSIMSHQVDSFDIDLEIEENLSIGADEIIHTKTRDLVLNEVFHVSTDVNAHSSPNGSIYSSLTHHHESPLRTDDECDSQLSIHEKESPIVDRELSLRLSSSIESLENLSELNGNMQISTLSANFGNSRLKDPSRPNREISQEQVEVIDLEEVTCIKEIQVAFRTKEDITQKTMVATPDKEYTYAEEQIMVIATDKEQNHSWEKSVNTPDKEDTSVHEEILDPTSDQECTRVQEDIIVATPDKECTSVQEEILVATPDKECTRVQEETLAAAPDKEENHSWEKIATTTDKEDTSVHEDILVAIPDKECTSVQEEILVATPDKKCTRVQEERLVAAPEKEENNYSEKTATTPDKEATCVQEEIEAATPDKEVINSLEETFTTPVKEDTSVHDDILVATRDKECTPVKEEKLVSTPDKEFTLVQEKISTMPNTQENKSWEETVTTPDKEDTCDQEERLVATHHKEDTHAPEETILDTPDKKEMCAYKKTLVATPGKEVLTPKEMLVTTDKEPDNPKKTRAATPCKKGSPSHKEKLVVIYEEEQEQAREQHKLVSPAKEDKESINGHNGLVECIQDEEMHGRNDQIADSPDKYQSSEHQEQKDALKRHLVGTPNKEKKQAYNGPQKAIPVKEKTRQSMGQVLATPEKVIKQPCQDQKAASPDKANNTSLKEQMVYSAKEEKLINSPAKEIIRPRMDIILIPDSKVKLANGEPMMTQPEKEIDGTLEKQMAASNKENYPSLNRILVGDAYSKENVHIEHLVYAVEQKTLSPQLKPLNRKTFMLNHNIDDDLGSDESMKRAAAEALPETKSPLSETSSELVMLSFSSHDSNNSSESNKFEGSTQNSPHEISDSSDDSSELAKVESSAHDSKIEEICISSDGYDMPEPTEAEGSQTRTPEVLVPDSPREEINVISDSYESSDSEKEEIDIEALDSDDKFVGFLKKKTDASEENSNLNETSENNSESESSHVDAKIVSSSSTNVSAHCIEQVEVKVSQRLKTYGKIAKTRLSSQNVGEIVEDVSLHSSLTQQGLKTYGRKSCIKECVLSPLKVGKEIISPEFIISPEVSDEENELLCKSLKRNLKSHLKRKEDEPRNWEKCDESPRKVVPEEQIEVPAIESSLGKFEKEKRIENPSALKEDSISIEDSDCEKAYKSNIESLEENSKGGTPTTSFRRSSRKSCSKSPTCCDDDTNSCNDNKLAATEEKAFSSPEKILITKLVNNLHSESSDSSNMVSAGSQSESLPSNSEEDIPTTRDHHLGSKLSAGSGISSNKKGKCYILLRLGDSTSNPMTKRRSICSTTLTSEDLLSSPSRNLRPRRNSGSYTPTRSRRLSGMSDAGAEDGRKTALPAVEEEEVGRGKRHKKKLDM